MTHTHALSLAKSTPKPNKPNVLLGFTGLLPLLLSVPILLLQLWGPGIVISIVTTAAVVVYHLRRGQGLTSLDALSILFSVTNAILYLGFKNPVLVEHLDLIIYSVFLAQILYSFRTSEPWTAQFARRSVSPELWSTPGFLKANRVTTLVWGACFLVCDVLVLALPLSNPAHEFAPIALVVATAVMTPRIARASVRRPAGA